MGLDSERWMAPLKAACAELDPAVLAEQDDC